jgi:hypothetical protein
MHPEFKAYVEAVCREANEAEPARPALRSNGGAHLVAESRQQLGRYYVELRMLPRLNKCSDEWSRHRDAIGYHGLV